VGSSAAFAITLGGGASEIVLIDLNDSLARAQAEDLVHATPFASPVRILAGDYAAFDGAQVVILNCGVGQQSERRTSIVSVGTSALLSPRAISAGCS
jgi:L-lactate dehydrogenase